MAIPGQERLLDSDFDEVVNLRDMGGFRTRDGKVTKYGVLYRSARLDESTKADVDQLLRMGVHTFIDLRDPIETTGHAKEIDARYQSIPIESAASTMFGRDTFERSILDPTYSQGALRRYKIGLLGASFKLAQASRAPDKYQLLKTFISDKRKGRTEAIAEDVMNPLGIIGQYTDIIDYCQGQVATVLKLAALPANQAVLFHCSHGKDRTGIIAALLLLAVGVSDKDVIDDYALTTVGLARRADQTRDELMTQKGLSEDFIGSEPKTMRDLLAHIRSNYGTPDMYLDKIGFTKEWRQRLASRFIEELQDE